MINKIKRLLKKINSNYIYYRNKNIDCRKAIVGFNCTLEGKNKICKNTSINKVRVGRGTYIGANCEFFNCNIGKYCSIANDVKIIYGRHPSKVFVSTHPAFFSVKKQAGFTYVNTSIFSENLFVDNILSAKIGNDVWIGENVRILEGVEIGDGAIIGSNSLVTKNIEPYSICGGVPAKIIDYRFCKEDIKFLLNLKWWEKGDEWIEYNAHLFNNISNFYKFK